MSITPGHLGAWLIKGNADAGALVERFRAEPRVHTWCVRPSYRTRLMVAGQPVVFWASGSRSRTVRYGVWGVGQLTGVAVSGDGESWSVPLDLEILPERQRLARALLRADPRLARAEVLRQPMGSNPSFLTPEEFAALREHLPQ
ncbi:hypothetical protein KIH74_32455 [Kineosporia sp. J2-2]|uniref:EVE domain-containing protein n=1 Tax=Kineosporia corallincola TaxID=2835133 RepID=A0ABS5TSD8_9ACTN|nr:hypothetical protein [Kineosporia corallincola]MBT0773702.1 hypothetical protein [Kineosporia corallincola]